MKAEININSIECCHNAFSSSFVISKANIPRLIFFFFKDDNSIILLFEIIPRFVMTKISFVN